MNKQEYIEFFKKLREVCCDNLSCDTCMLDELCNDDEDNFIPAPNEWTNKEIEERAESFERWKNRKNG